MKLAMKVQGHLRLHYGVHLVQWIRYGEFQSNSPTVSGGRQHQIRSYAADDDDSLLNQC